MEMRGGSLTCSEPPPLLLPPPPLEKPARASSPHPNQTHQTAAAFMPRCSNQKPKRPLTLRKPCEQGSRAPRCCRVVCTCTSQRNSQVSRDLRGKSWRVVTRDWGKWWWWWWGEGWREGKRRRRIAHAEAGCDWWTQGVERMKREMGSIF